MTGFTLTILVTTQADEFHLYWAATVGQYLQLFNFAMTQDQFTDTTGVPTLYRLPFDSSQVTFDTGTENVLVKNLISSFSSTSIPHHATPTSTRQPRTANLQSRRKSGLAVAPAIVGGKITSTELQQLFLDSVKLPLPNLAKPPQFCSISNQSNKLDIYFAIGKKTCGGGSCIYEHGIRCSKNNLRCVHIRSNPLKANNHNAN